MSHGMDIEKLVLEMGYVLAVPKSTPTPSYYRLGDGTILSVLVNINHVLTDALESGVGAINHNTDIRVYVPHRYKTHKPAQPDRPPNIVDQDVECTPLMEGFNDYAVGKDIIISAKAVVGQVAKMDTYSNAGEPIYNLNVQPVIKVVDKRQQSFAPDMR